MDQPLIKETHPEPLLEITNLSLATDTNVLHLNPTSKFNSSFNMMVN